MAAIVEPRVNLKQIASSKLLPPTNRSVNFIVSS